MASNIINRIALIIQGQVQGVGFRPFIWRLAHECNLTGSVRNTSAGVRIEIQGKDVDNFEKFMLEQLPPLAKIVNINKFPLSLIPGEKEFVIECSEGHAGQNVLVSPDVSVCDQCLDDIRDPANPRYGYAFTNCTNCGPRYTITKKIPYDRPNTVMDCFKLCPTCEAEYTNPADRRFHAQPVACPICGPKLWFIDQKDAMAGNTALNPQNAQNALQKAGKVIIDGGIVALKGLGGFQLVCDATNEQAVNTLRKRKSRPHKALAVMARSLEEISKFCDLGAAQKKLLGGMEKPIVLCPEKQNPEIKLSSQIAPDCAQIGVMLPYTPLHVLLLDWLEENGLRSPVLVMTSANPANEPICLGNREAISRLKHLADAWLLHNRDILCRVDDSVVGVDIPFKEESNKEEKINSIRRARGYVPAPVRLVDNGITTSVFGAGAELKTTFCLTRADQAFVSPHIGDLKNPATLAFYTQTLAHMQALLETEPEVIVHDLHPDFISTHFAKNLAAQNNLPIIALQHHASHAAAVLGENNHYSPALILCLDGSGLGEDGTIWGGELILMDLAKAHWQRVGRLAPFPLAGGEMAIKQPWRIAEALGQSGNEVNTKERLAVREMLARNINCVPTSSCGRLFDGVASLLGLCHEITYEGQAAMRLQYAAQKWLAANNINDLTAPEIEIITRDELLTLDSYAIFNNCANQLQKTSDVHFIAAFFHFSLVKYLVDLCTTAAQKYNVSTIALSGGVFQNGLMLSLLRHQLTQAGLRPLIHSSLPCGDGCISYGQAVWGRQMLANKKVKNSAK